MTEKFSTVFSDKTGKCKGSSITIQVKKNAVPVIQPPRPIPLHYKDRLKKEINSMDYTSVSSVPAVLQLVRLFGGTLINSLVQQVFYGLVDSLLIVEICQQKKD